MKLLNDEYLLNKIKNFISTEFITIPFEGGIKRTLFGIDTYKPFICHPFEYINFFGIDIRIDADSVHYYPNQVESISNDLSFGEPVDLVTGD